jgi:hypothetical protein
MSGGGVRERVKGLGAEPIGGALKQSGTPQHATAGVAQQPAGTPKKKSGICV